jgi:hypothetical protein
VEDARAAVFEVGAPRIAFSLLHGRRGLDRGGERTKRQRSSASPVDPGRSSTFVPAPEAADRHPRIALDRWLPGIPGVSAAHSRKGFDRARERGAEGRYVLVPGALHGVALRSPWGKLVPLPKARRWAEVVEEELRRFAAS